jgi:hypothetical protein
MIVLAEQPDDFRIVVVRSRARRAAISSSDISEIGHGPATSGGPEKSESDRPKLRKGDQGEGPRATKKASDRRLFYAGFHELLLLCTRARLTPKCGTGKPAI